MSYKRSGIARVGPSYTQRQAKRLVRKLPGGGRPVCHCPPRGVNDDPDDPAHIGYEALREWVSSTARVAAARARPPAARARLLTRIGDTRVVYVNGAKVLNLT